MRPEEIEDEESPFNAASGRRWFQYLFGVVVVGVLAYWAFTAFAPGGSGLSMNRLDQQKLDWELQAEAVQQEEAKAAEEAEKEAAAQ